MRVIDGIKLLNGDYPTDGPLPRCTINQDFMVTGWSRERGLYAVGQGVDLESAIAIVRLHTGSSDYVDFTQGVEIQLFPTSV
jgi:hypothetical protein